MREGNARRLPGFVYVKTRSGLVIPFKPPALDYVSAAERELEREPTYLLTTPGPTYEGRIVRAADGELELWLERVDDGQADELEQRAAAAEPARIAGPL